MMRFVKTRGLRDVNVQALEQHCTGENAYNEMSHVSLTELLFDKLTRK